MKHTRVTDELRERASLYAAGAMNEDELQAYTAHLEEDQCDVCIAVVNEFQSAISQLAFIVPSSTPPPEIKDKLMEQARKLEKTPKPKLPE